MKTNPLLLESVQCPTIKPKKKFPAPWSRKNSKNDKKLSKKLQKLESFWVFVFAVPKHMAHKMVITSNFVSQKAFINF